MRRPVAIMMVSLAACGDGDGGGGTSDAELEAEVVAAMHESLTSDLADLAAAARELQAAAPARVWDDAAITAMRTAWRKTRVAYELTEGALAPLFPDIDFAIDARYDDYLAELGPSGDANPFDGEGVTGMHGMERILFATVVRPEVIAFESTLPGYRAPAVPATDGEAAAFAGAGGIAQRLIADVDELHAQWQPAAIDIGAAYVGLVGLMGEQKEKVNLAATGEEESRYANITLFDLRNNLAGTRKVYELFRTWIATKDGGTAADANIQAKFDVLEQLYAETPVDALPPVPATWSSDMPSTADLATPFGRLWQTVHAETDPNTAGSIVFEMNRVAIMLGFPEFIAE